MNRTDNITTHFKWNEFIRNEDPLPDAPILCNIEFLAHRLETVRTMTGKPMAINSGYRTWAHQVAIYKQLGRPPLKTSFHLSGNAVDIPRRSLNAHVIYYLWKKWKGGMGRYTWGIHLDIRNYKARWGRRPDMPIGYNEKVFLEKKDIK